MIYPGYLLNPGDMFQVDPERVMFATGVPRENVKSTNTSNSEEGGMESAPATPEEDAGEASEETSAAEDEDEADTKEEEKDPRQTLKSLLSQAKTLISKTPDRVPGKRKQDVRKFQKAIQRTLSKSKTSTILTDSLEAQFLELKSILQVPDKLPDNPEATEADFAREKAAEKESGSESSSDGSKSNATTSADSTVIDLQSLTNSDMRALQRAMSLLRDNPVDPDKPYATPWMPRPYMSAFAFIPRYLEVNQNICAAVYLRHPVARPGMAEVPSPYPEGTQGEAFNWYLRRR